MKRLFRQTLARRILITALLAFGLCFIVITAFNIFQVYSALGINLDAGRKAFVESLSQSLSRYETDEQIRAAAEGLQRMIEAQSAQAKQPSTPNILVWTRDGNRIYSSIDFPPQRPLGLASTASGFIWGGKNYIVTSVTSPRYTVDVIDSTPIKSIYKLILQDLLGDLLLKMAIAFPLVLLPVWFAVHTGLRPLGALSDTLRRRPIDDLTPISSDMRY
jgi:two-component system, OmpR family, sensor histidine kinase QseC